MHSQCFVDTGPKGITLNSDDWKDRCVNSASQDTAGHIHINLQSSVAVRGVILRGRTRSPGTVQNETNTGLKCHGVAKASGLWLARRKDVYSQHPVSMVGVVLRAASIRIKLSFRVCREGS